ncbi:DUF3429 domain-containing protein [Gammaproteobacteria bacterium]|nr:DUF3429 domain-containing protein [Gammaproteobacteria bacterium]MDC1251728.1 DUF3429 domain-containing protein [Gammaproteobacteria bacterium]
MNLNTRRILGYLGLIPFITFSFVPLFIPFPEGYIFNLLLSFYGAVILSFLGGMTWGWHDSESHNLSLIIGIIFSLIGFFIIAISNMFLYYSLCISLISFIAFYLFELKVSNQMKDEGYKLLRTTLTSVVAICYLTSISTFNW